MSLKIKSPEQLEREQVIARTRFEESDLERAREIGMLFGGNGYSHDEQIRVVADRLRGWREIDCSPP